MWLMSMLRSGGDNGCVHKGAARSKGGSQPYVGGPCALRVDPLMMFHALRLLLHPRVCGSDTHPCSALEALHAPVYMADPTGVPTIALGPWQVRSHDSRKHSHPPLGRNSSPVRRSRTDSAHRLDVSLVRCTRSHPFPSAHGTPHSCHEAPTYTGARCPKLQRRLR